jgi:hypothetical protein
VGAYDLLIAGATPAESNAARDVAFRDGLVAAVEERIDPSEATEVLA